MASTSKGKQREKNFSLFPTEEEAACVRLSRKRKFETVEREEHLHERLSELKVLYKQYEEREKARAQEVLKKVKQALADQEEKSLQR